MLCTTKEAVMRGRKKGQPLAEQEEPLVRAAAVGHPTLAPFLLKLPLPLPVDTRSQKAGCAPGMLWSGRGNLLWAAGMVSVNAN